MKWSKRKTETIRTQSRTVSYTKNRFKTKRPSGTSRHLNPNGHYTFDALISAKRCRVQVTNRPTRAPGSARLLLATLQATRPKGPASTCWTITRSGSRARRVPYNRSRAVGEPTERRCALTPLGPFVIQFVSFFDQESQCGTSRRGLGASDHSNRGTAWENSAKRAARTAAKHGANVISGILVGA